MSELEDHYRQDLEKYDFQGVADDVMSLVDVPTAVITTVRWALIVPALVAVVTAAIFVGRMPSWVLVPFVIGAVVLSMVGALAIGILIVAKNRLEETTGATGRILETVSTVHHDLVQMRGAEVTQSAAIDLAHGFINSGALETSAVAFLPSPIRVVAKPLAKWAMWAPRKLLERTTEALIEDMPWEVLDRKTEDLTAGVADRVSVLADIDAGYADAQLKIENTVAAVISKTTTPLKVLVVALMTPLAIYLLIGGALS